MARLALILLALLAIPARAASQDRPVADDLEHRSVVYLQQGAPAPFAGDLYRPSISSECIWLKKNSTKLDEIAKGKCLALLAEADAHCLARLELQAAQCKASIDIVTAPAPAVCGWWCRAKFIGAGMVVGIVVMGGAWWWSGR